MTEKSKADAIVAPLRVLGEAAALRVGLAALRQLTVQQRAAMAADWALWARPKQLPPPGRWRTWGFLTGRGFGKTVAVANFVVEEARGGRAALICLLAQDEQSSIDLQVNGPSGLIAVSPPWFKPQWEASALQLVWPNGARAYVRTPEVPGKIRGLEYHLTWASELQSWPAATRQEALDNVFLSTRLGAARVVWDATPKRRHPLLKELLARRLADPEAHVVMRGTTHENATNLGEGYVAEIQRKFGGTTRGREELLGEMLEDSETSLVKQSKIDGARRPSAARYARKVVSIDPAVSDRKGSDTTGLVLAAVGADGQGYVLGDRSGKHKPEVWAAIALDWYVGEACDLVIAETNKGGALVAQNLRSLAKERGLEVIVVGKDERPVRVAGKVFVKEVFARGAKEDRAEPVATAYERGRISHVVGVDLASLEDTLTTWEPTPNADSPGDLDALVHAMVELLDLSKNTPDAKAGFVGLDAALKQVLTPPARSPSLNNLSAILRGRPDRL